MPFRELGPIRQDLSFSRMNFYSAHNMLLKDIPKIIPFSLASLRSGFGTISWRLKFCALELLESPCFPFPDVISKWLTCNPFLLKSFVIHNFPFSFQQTGVKPAVKIGNEDYIYCQFSLSNPLNLEKFSITLDGDNEYYLSAVAGTAKKGMHIAFSRLKWI